jgi:hypothetical protein
MSSYKRRLAVSTVAGGRIGWGGARSPPAFRPTPASVGWVRPARGVVAVASDLSVPVPPGAPPIELDETVALLDLPGAVPCAPVVADAAARVPAGGIGYTHVIVRGFGASPSVAVADGGDGEGACVNSGGEPPVPWSDRGFLLAAGSGAWRRRDAGAGVVSASLHASSRRASDR